MGDERDDPTNSPPSRRVQRNLVHVFDQHVQRRCDVSEHPIEVSVCEQWERVPSSDAVHLDAVEPRVRGTSRPAPTEESNVMPGACETTEYFVHVNLGAAGLRIVTVLPVEEQNAH